MLVRYVGEGFEDECDSECYLVGLFLKSFLVKIFTVLQ